jgi:hypothetical protein
MLGLIVTLLAILLVICLALHSSDPKIKSEFDFIFGRERRRKNTEEEGKPNIGNLA